MAYLKNGPYLSCAFQDPVILNTNCTNAKKQSTLWVLLMLKLRWKFDLKSKDNLTIDFEHTFTTKLINSKVQRISLLYKPGYCSRVSIFLFLNHSGRYLFNTKSNLLIIRPHNNIWLLCQVWEFLKYTQYWKAWSNLTSRLENEKLTLSSRS